MPPRDLQPRTGEMPFGGGDPAGGRADVLSHLTVEALDAASPCEVNPEISTPTPGLHTGRPLGGIAVSGVGENIHTTKPPEALTPLDTIRDTTTVLCRLRADATNATQADLALGA